MQKRPILTKSIGAALLLGALSSSLSLADPAPDPKAAKPADTTIHYGKKLNEPFWQRLNEAFMEQFGASVCSPPAPPASKDAKAVAPAPTRRIGPAPFDAPPYYNSDWQIGGGPNVIGDPGALRDAPYPLMQAIYDGPFGESWYKSRIQIYGWVTVSANLSTSHNTLKGFANNFPEVYDEKANTITNDQEVLYVERMADMDQQDHLDWGFRWTFLYGQDYRFMASRGMLNDGTLFHRNRQQGFDMPMMYANLYIPWILQGEELIIGRIISMPDIEQQLAPQNPMASHSLVYAFDDYTDWGFWTNTKINKNWILQAGITDGVDTAIWSNHLHDPGNQPTGSAHVQYISSNNMDSLYLGMNSFNNGHFGFNNLQECIESYSHKFNDKIWTSFEYQYMWTDHCTTAPTKTVPIEDGFYPTKAGRAFGTGLLNYTFFRLSCNTFFTIRNEWWDDPHGYRSGYGSIYSEHSIGITWFPSRLVMIRPELRFDHAYKHDGLASSSAGFNSTGEVEHVAGPYDDGTRQSQLTAAIDLTIRF